MRQMIVAFTGLKGSGKDSAADALIEAFNFKKINLADPLKAVCKIMFGLTDLEMSDRDLKERVLPRWPSKSPRYLMQTMGTEASRDIFHPDVWIRAWEIAADSYPFVTCADMRFSNECGFFQRKGALLVRVVRPDLVGDDRSGHASEVDVPNLKVDCEILNDGTLEDLKAKAVKLVRNYCNG